MLAFVGCGDAPEGDENNVTVEVATPPVNVATPPVYVENDYNITIVVPADDSGSSSSSSSSEPCADAACNEVSGNSSSTATTTNVYSPCAQGKTCPTGCNANNLDACGLPVNYVGKGTSYDPYLLFANGQVNVKGETWTYYKIQNNFNSNCTYRIIFPVHVTSSYLYDEQKIELPRTYDKGAYIVDSNKSIFMDLYSVADGFIEIYSECWVETR
jgi:hypothetical protein